MKALYTLSTIVLFLRCFSSVHSLSNSHYGPFNLVIKRTQFCKGPRKEECTVTTSSVVNETTIVSDTIVKDNITNIQGILFATSMETKQTVKHEFKRLCKHPHWEPLFAKLYSLKNCYILSGHYHNAMNVQESSQKYYGGSFVYGGWIFKTVIYNNNCNFMCSIVEIHFIPKRKI